METNFIAAMIAIVLITFLLRVRADMKWQKNIKPGDCYYRYTNVGKRHGEIISIKGDEITGKEYYKKHYGICKVRRQDIYPDY